MVAGPTLSSLVRGIAPGRTHAVCAVTPSAVQPTWQKSAALRTNRPCLITSPDLAAGVWDGHGGTACSEYVESHAFPAFAAARCPLRR